MIVVLPVLTDLILRNEWVSSFFKKKKKKKGGEGKREKKKEIDQ